MADSQQGMRITDLEVDQVLGFIVGITGSKALQYLGTDLADGTKYEADLKKAKVMIDCTTYLVEQMVPFIGVDEAKEFKSMITDLQLRYVKLT